MHKSEINIWKKVKIADYEYISDEIKSEVEGLSLIFLKGDLGAGKTSFARVFCSSESKATSPTYSIVQEYDDILHADFYRIKSEDEIIELALDSYIEDKKFFLAEWGEQYYQEISFYMPENTSYFTLNFEVGENQSFRNLILEEIDPLLS